MSRIRATIQGRSPSPERQQYSLMAVMINGELAPGIPVWLDPRTGSGK
jgi:hypothetical protein